ncbi:tetratricopeptide repeat domain 27 [Ramaria rubella]|nr:tetratricopeptide repeat domain 27 [Ramaria rubella]
MRAKGYKTMPQLGYFETDLLQMSIVNVILSGVTSGVTSRDDSKFRNMSLEEVEWALIQGLWPKDKSHSDSELLTLAHDTIQGNFSAVLTTSVAKNLLTVAPSPSSQSLETLFTFESPLTPEAELSRLCVGVALLHAFIQLNWTGPDLDLLPSTLVTPTDSEILSDESLNQKAIAELAYRGEPAYHLAASPVFLRWSLLIFARPYQHTRSAAWWRLRATIIHQYTLDDPAHVPPTFFAGLESLGSYLNQKNQLDLLGRFILEQGLLYHLFGNDRVAADHFVRAARATGLEYELTGALGKRTKFQQTELSQLVLLAESRKRGDDHIEGTAQSTTSSTEPTPLPDTLALNDDTLLEQTEFTSSQPTSSTSRLAHLSPASQPPLHPLDQCILLSLCLNVKNTSPTHGLTSEQMMPYIARVISHPRNWSIHTMTLLLRSRLEATRTRTVERAVLQLQALVDQMPTADSALPERLLYVHDIPLPSKWHLERELAMRFLTLGIVKSALQIFERLEMWEEVVKCWQVMERPQKGIAIVYDLLEGRKEEAEQVLARGKTSRRRDSAREAKLWCLLGDLEPEHARTHYERAWEVSNETSGRAMRSLGGYYYARNEFVEAIPCLRRAAAINPMLSRTWFIMGCALVRLERWEEAREAFARCVVIDDEDGESWSNLASVYLRMGTAGQTLRNASEDDLDESTAPPSLSSSTTNAIPFANKMLAFQALKQGIKFSYENWRMWVNYMVVSVDVGELAEATRATSRIVELRAERDGAGCVDEEVLERLVDAVTRVPFDQPTDATGRTSNEGLGLLPRVLDLFERTILPRLSSPRIFRAYARLLTWQGRWADTLKAHLDAYREGPAGQMTNSETDVGKWREAVGEVEDVVDVMRNFGPRADGSRWLFQARSVVRSFMGKTKDFEDEPEWEKLVALREELQGEEQ